MGGYQKSEVREFARLAGLEVCDKPDSQDFYSGNINDILQKAPNRVIFVDKRRQNSGAAHQGIWNYTIGQRRGMGIAAERPLYVIAIRPERREVVLGYDDDTLRQKLYCQNLSWLSVSDIASPRRLTVKIRSSQTPAAALLTPTSPTVRKSVLTICKRPSLPGQSAVFYDNDLLLGGGIICALTACESLPTAISCGGKT